MVENLKEFVDSFINDFVEEANLVMFYSEDEIEEIKFSLETRFMNRLVDFMNEV